MHNYTHIKLNSQSIFFLGQTPNQLPRQKSIQVLLQWNRANAKGRPSISPRDRDPAVHVPGPPHPSSSSPISRRSPQPLLRSPFPEEEEKNTAPSPPRPPFSRCSRHRASRRNSSSSSPARRRPPISVPRIAARVGRSDRPIRCLEASSRASDRALRPACSARASCYAAEPGTLPGKRDYRLRFGGRILGSKIR